MKVARPYMDAGLAGFLLGIVLLLSFVMAGRGLGASGAFASVAAHGIEATAPRLLEQSASLSDRLRTDTPLLQSWIFWEVVGVLLGGALSATLAHRRTPPDTITRGPRLARAAAGGLLMGIGARLAYGCTSGLALSGGALLSTGAWLFIPVAFATAVVVTLAGRASLAVE